MIPKKINLFKSLNIIILTLLSVLIASCDNSGLANKDKEELNELIKEYLLNNPEIVYAAMENSINNQREMANQLVGITAIDNFLSISNIDTANIANPDVKNFDVMIVEFIDYNCGYCRSGYPKVKELVNEGNIRWIIRDLPLLTKTSEGLAKIALSLRGSNKFEDYHEYVLGLKGEITEDRFFNILKKFDISPEGVNNTLKDSEIKLIIDSNYDLAKSLKAQGTPFFVIYSADGKYAEIVDGMDVNRIFKAIGDIRNKMSQKK